MRILCARGYRQYLSPYLSQRATDKQASASRPARKGAAGARRDCSGAGLGPQSAIAAFQRLGSAVALPGAVPYKGDGGCTSRAGPCPGAGWSRTHKRHPCMWLMPRASRRGTKSRAAWGRIIAVNWAVSSAKAPCLS